MHSPLGDFINGEFIAPEGETLVSYNPAKPSDVILKTSWELNRIEAAIHAASTSQPGWSQLSTRERCATLSRLHEALSEHREQMIDAVILETGKVLSDATEEVDKLLALFHEVSGVLERRDKDNAVFLHPLGVVGIITPYHLPLLMLHRHLLPALSVGNTVIVKPSAETPLSAQIYFQCVEQAGLPTGIANLVQGAPEASELLIKHHQVQGVCFSGSWSRGQEITAIAQERRDLFLSLEILENNTAVILDDACIRQAIHEIALGAFLTTGQQHTKTSIIIVAKSHFQSVLRQLRKIAESLQFGDPRDPNSFAGPLISKSGIEQLIIGQKAALNGGAEPYYYKPVELESHFVHPSIHIMPKDVTSISGYTDLPLFGPDIAVHSVSSTEEAIYLLRACSNRGTNSLFTRSRNLFERFRRETHSSALHWNCRTNVSLFQPDASELIKKIPALVGKNDCRFTSYPMSTCTSSPGDFEAHRALLHLLPQTSLDDMEERHLTEESYEADRWIKRPLRKLTMQHAHGDTPPQSQLYLNRLYAGQRMVQEKKPLVIDHLRSYGPWMISIDEQPLSVLDGMSQTATLPGGFTPDILVSAYYDGQFENSAIHAPDTTVKNSQEGELYRNTLTSILGPQLQHISFVGSGAEANEKALALCHLQTSNPKKKNSILAFKGSFHGRSLLTIHTTWNPDKRSPFELASYKVQFAPFPVAHGAAEGTFPEPESYGELLSKRKTEKLLKGSWKQADPLLKDELQSLVAADMAMRSGNIFACIVEPMQSEGGDRYASARFFRGLRLLTRAYDVPLIFDEVQTGMGLSGPFLWHSRFKLVDSSGRPDHPDAVTLAKRAQVGICASRFPDPEPTASHTASLVRGRLNAETLIDEAHANKVETWLKEHLQLMATRYPHWVGNPRACGYAAAFDLPEAEHLKAYIKQRFYRGTVVYGAGSRTVRYRLNTSYTEQHVAQLFSTVNRTLAWLEANPNQTTPSRSVCSESMPSTAEPPEFRITRLDSRNVSKCIKKVITLESEKLPAHQRHTKDRLQLASEPGGIALLVECREKENDDFTLAGHLFAAPLERVNNLNGLRDDNLGKDNTLFVLAFLPFSEKTACPATDTLKRAFLDAAREERTLQGHPRYRFISGISSADSITPCLYRELGGYLVHESPSDSARNSTDQGSYYRVPLGSPVSEKSRSFKAEDLTHLDLSDGISAPFGVGPISLREAEARGLLYGPTLNKITVLNYVTPAIVRCVEWISAITPNLPHLYLTNGRDETVDKSLKLLKWHRQEAHTAIGLEGGYLGHTTAAARSLSDPQVHRQGPTYFDWKRIPHPAVEDPNKTLNALNIVVKKAGGPENIFGLFIETVQERTGRVLDDAFFEALNQFRTKTGIPIVLVETATACYRSGNKPFAYPSHLFTPDILLWWGGGQLGMIHLGHDFWVPEPLAMASTWDGDELSLIRVYHHLRTARTLDLNKAVEAWEEVMGLLGENKMIEAGGRGLYRTLSGPGVEALGKKLDAMGIQAHQFPNGVMPLIPRLDCAFESAKVLKSVIEKDR
jgi:acyl-CoA reductase-like NAD-dependent aldehyde dehydrogenase/4-aminobutyrate aminotransferase-like enzyme